MASGKTTFGRALAERLGWNFLDLDSELEKEYGKPAGRIIEEEGERVFRLKESMALKKTVGLRHTIVACGGGTPCYRDNMEFMTLHGLTLWLVASPERIVERILEAGPTRPLVAGKSRDELMEFVCAHLLERQPYYSRAQMRFSGEHLESGREIDAAVDSFLKNNGILTDTLKEIP